MTVLQIHHEKQKPLVVTYSDWKYFSNENLGTEFLSAMERYSNIYFADFHLEFLYLLYKHVPVMKRHIIANKKCFMDNKNLIKQSWLGLSFVINVWDSKRKEIGLHMLSSATTN